MRENAAQKGTNKAPSTGRLQDLGVSRGNLESFNSCRGQASFMVLFLSVGVCALFYVASYVCFLFVRPEFINPNDGPVAAFRRFYYPLRYIDAARPPWYSKTRDGWLEVKIDWINVGNGHL